MNFIYICRNGENEELRYSIRSVLHFYPDARIHIFGGKPRWYSGEYTEVKDSGTKFDNINKCYEAICSSHIKDFILMNDDFYILDKPSGFIFYDGYIEDKIEKHTQQHGLSKYSRILSDANKKLKKMGIQKPLNYDVHTPMMFNTKLLSDIIDISYAPRSIYGNIYNIGGEKMSDVKIYRHTDNIHINGYFLSSEDNSFNKINNLLQNKFSKPSIYEPSLLISSKI